MKPIWWSTLVLLGMLCFGPADGHAQLPLVLFDGFNSGFVDGNLWHGQQGLGGGPDEPNTEVSRRVANGQLNMSLRTFGSADSDSGSGPGGTNQLRFNDAAPITAFESVITVVSALAEGCPANGTSTRVRAALQGGFFNDWASTGPGDETGDVHAGFQLVLDSAFGRAIETFVFRCDTANCSLSSTVDSATMVTTWNVGQTRRLRIEWDEANSRFRFFLNAGGKGQEVVDLFYPQAVSGPPGFPTSKQLRVRNTVADCTAGRRQASIDARFDQVMVNP